jgi:hypothetical protein
VLLLSDVHHFILHSNPRVPFIDYLELVLQLLIGFLLTSNGGIVVTELRLILLVLSLELVNSILT